MLELNQNKPNSLVKLLFITLCIAIYSPSFNLSLLLNDISIYTVVHSVYANKIDLPKHSASVDPLEERH